MTVREYYKHFASIYGGITAAISSTPLISAFLPSDYARYLFPPLGGMQPFSQTASVILIGLTTILVYFTKDLAFVSSKKGRVKYIVTFLSISIISLLIFLGLYQRFVCTIDIPARDEQKTFSIGYERTEFTQTDEFKTEFKNEEDCTMLKQRGAAEEEVRVLWTPRSIIVARLSLLASYIFFLLPVVAVGSLAVLFDKLGAAPNP